MLERYRCDGRVDRAKGLMNRLKMMWYLGTGIPLNRPPFVFFIKRKKKKKKRQPMFPTFYCVETVEFVFMWDRYIPFPRPLSPSILIPVPD